MGPHGSRMIGPVWGRFALAATALLFAGGCASTNMTSFRDPAYRTQGFSKIIVYANTYDLGWRSSIEDAIVVGLTNAGVAAIGSMDIIPPTRHMAREQIDSALAVHDVDAFLLLTVGNTGQDRVYIPARNSTTSTSGTVTTYGGMVRYSESSSTSTAGGYEISKPWASATTNLFDARTGKMAWMATSFSGGDGYANLETVLYSYCNEVVSRLVSERVANVTLKNSPK